ncbi:MAG: heavy-metal-associated domain-containing protein [Lachnospiraceae bacterium]|nr:heavy-metal-associated domain-containing protein [Lachnospiraceae bacterium]
MEDMIIVGVIVILVIVGILSGKKHFKGEGGCCGGGSTPVPKQRKKLGKVVAQKVILIEGMTCEHCKNRVEKCINDIPGAAAKVDLKKKSAVISLETEVSDEQLRAAIEDAGYKVVEINSKS